MSVHTDRPGKFLFGCLIVVLCWIIGAGQLLAGRSDKSTDPAAQSLAVQQTSSSANFSGLATPFQWAMHQGPLAAYCFIGAIVAWVTSVVARQIVLGTRGEDVDSAVRAANIPLWSLFDFVASLVIVTSATVIILRGFGWLFALLIGVTTLVCYFLAFGPQQIAEYCRQVAAWLDEHYDATMVNGDLPLGQVRPDFRGSIIVPATFWQVMRGGHRSVRTVPVGLVIFGLGVMVTFGVMTVWERPAEPVLPDVHHNRTPTLLAIPSGRLETAGREIVAQSLELDPIDDREVSAGERIIITARLANPTAAETGLRFALSPAVPPGARFYADSGVFVWTPTEPGTYRFAVRAESDSASRPGDEMAFAIIVTGSERSAQIAEIADQTVREHETMVIPVRLVNRSALNGPVRFKLNFGAPAGAEIDPKSGVITWTPDQPGSFRITVQAVAETAQTARIERTFGVIVTAVERTPELVEILDRTAVEGELIHLIAQLKDASQLRGRLQYRLDDSAAKGATIDADSGLFTWRPTAAGTYEFTILAATDSATASPSETSFRVVVAAAPRPPVLARVDDCSVNENEELVVAIKLKSASHSTGSVRFSLGDDAPDGAAIDPVTGIFTWTPAQPGTYPIQVHCESRTPDRLSDQTAFQVVVHEVSTAPQLAEIGNKIVRAGETLLVSVKVKDPGRPSGPLVFTTSRDSVPGAEIDSRTGVIRWNVAAETAAGEYPIQVRVRNQARPALSDEVSFHVTVIAGDSATSKPTSTTESIEFEPIENRIVESGSLVRLMIHPIGYETDSDDLEYSLAPGAPSGSAMNPRTGLFTWRPTSEHASRLYFVTVRVRDTAHEGRTGECRFAIKVNGDDAGHVDESPPKETAPKGDTGGAVDAPKSLWPTTPDDNQGDGIRGDGGDEPEGSYRNSIGMRLIRIPSGQFQMGSRPRSEDLAPLDETEAARFKDEQPQHPVRISRSYFMGAFEVTVGEFRQFVEASGYRTDAECDGQGGYAFDPTSHEFRWGKQFDWRSPGWSQTLDHPVVNVSWNDAAAFCCWLSEREGFAYRLPSEAEWEFACRAGTDTNYSSGDTIEELAAVANLGDESFRQTIRPGYSDVVLVAGHDGPAFTTPVGKFLPNALGLYDMHGNVFEWCGDWYGSSYYQESPLVDPLGPPSGTKHVFRGGSYFNSPFYSRSSFRNGFAPQARVPYLGFRVVMEMPIEESADPEPPVSTNLLLEKQ